MLLGIKSIIVEINNDNKKTIIVIIGIYISKDSFYMDILY